MQEKYIIDTLTNMPPESAADFLNALDIDHLRLIGACVGISYVEDDGWASGLLVKAILSAIQKETLIYGINAEIQLVNKGGKYIYEIAINGDEKTLGGGDFETISDARNAAKQHLTNHAIEQIDKLY
jgi:hypothetical protein